MPRLRHFYGQNHYHYFTENIYRRARIFDSDRFQHHFVCALDELRAELGFKIFGYMHNNPVQRGLVAHPGDWPWSSWRFYYRADCSLLAMDRGR